MALKVMSVTDLRLEVLREASLGADSVSAICRRYGISRETFYVYLRRYRAEGLDGLEPRSRQPIHQPSRMPEATEVAICAMRKDHPKWGARRIRAELRRDGVGPPAISSIHQALVRNNLVLAQPPRPRPATERFERPSPNELWQIDFTQLALADGSQVWAVDILDDHARFLIAERASTGPTGAAALACFEWAISRYGIPAQVLSDNGTCFTGRLVGTTVAFERRLQALGVRLINARPYHPQTCGKLERFHRTLKEWLAEPPPARSIDELQTLLDHFRTHYNEERPHQGIEDLTPAERYESTPPVAEPTLPAISAPVRYPEGSILRKVSSCGNLSYKRHMIRVGSEWSLCVFRVEVIDGVVHLFYGEQLVRALRFSPGLTYYGSLRTRKEGRKRP